MAIVVYATRSCDPKETQTVRARFGAFIRAVSTYWISVARERLVDASPRVAGEVALVANARVTANLVRTVKTIAVAVTEIRMRNALVATRTLQKMKSTPDACEIQCRIIASGLDRL